MNGVSKSEDVTIPVTALENEGGLAAQPGFLANMPPPQVGTEFWLTQQLVGGILTQAAVLADVVVTPGVPLTLEQLGQISAGLARHIDGARAAIGIAPPSN